MITEAEGNLLTAPVEALVNTVNTEGVMGKGIALQFKNAFPLMFKEYSSAAKRGEVRIGHMHVWATQSLTGPRYVINFPTKAHWRAKSRIVDIESGLSDLIRVVQDLGITSIAVPPLGCGNGGLMWSDVEPRIRAAFDSLPEVDVRIFPPAGAPPAREMVVNTKQPSMTPGRAALVALIAMYTRRSLSQPSLIETQKIMYFMQAFGENLKLDYHANRYGPYADNLRKVLEAVEGHYLVGYGDGSAKVYESSPLAPLTGAVELADERLEEFPETRARIERVLELADGYESAYGMELLATVHWVAEHEAAGEPDVVLAEKVAAWSPRKARMFTPSHVATALATLRANGLLVND